MPTTDEIRREWKAIRSELGNIICHIDVQTERLGEAQTSWQKGYDFGYRDGYKNGLNESHEDYCRGYDEGSEDTWEIACRIVQMDVHERAKAFFSEAVAATHDEPFKRFSAQEAIQKLKEYDAAMHQVSHSNAQKFIEVFGFAPGYEILDDGREVYPSLNDEFWNAEYKGPEKENIE